MKTYKYKVQVAYTIVETREFEFEYGEPSMRAGEVLDFVNDSLDFSSGKIIDREILREHLVSDSLEVHSQP
jgi:hypothetical protein